LYPADVHGSVGFSTGVAVNSDESAFWNHRAACLGLKSGSGCAISFEIQVVSQFYVLSRAYNSKIALLAAFTLGPDSAR